MFKDEVAADVVADQSAGLAPEAATGAEESGNPAGELRRRSLVAFGIGVAALSGIAVATALGGGETGGLESFPMTTCCINPGDVN